MERVGEYVEVLELGRKTGSGVWAGFDRSPSGLYCVVLKQPLSRVPESRRSGPPARKGTSIFGMAAGSLWRRGGNTAASHNNEWGTQTRYGK